MSQRGAPRFRGTGPALLILLALVAAAGPGMTGEDPAAELAEALRSLGPPGLLWGRLAVEEESPDGPWTPLGGVEIRVYPAVPTLVAELERIRRSARDSGSLHGTAVARVQGALRAYQAQVEAATRGTAAPEELEKARRRVTDSAGVFVFEELPSGEWLLVAIRVTPYRAPAARDEPRSRARRDRFLRKSVAPAREAEAWVTRVRVGPGERVSVFLTDRTRWFVGPLR